MTFRDLARSYFDKARSRRRALPLFLEDKNYSDVVREAQEIVELCLKGSLRAVGIDPPRWHDVGPILQGNRERLPSGIADELESVALISARLRKERELAFYGDVDFIPSKRYGEADARQAIREADTVLDFFRKVMEGIGEL